MGYLTKQGHILLEEGNVEEHGKIVEEGELKEERRTCQRGIPVLYKIMVQKERKAGTNHQNLGCQLVLEGGLLSVVF